MLVGANPVPNTSGRSLVAAYGVAAILGIVFLPAPPEAPLRNVLAALQDPAPGGVEQTLSDLRPKLLNRHEITRILDYFYPAGLRSAGLGGTAVLKAYVGLDGSVGGAGLLDSSGYPELDQAAERVVRELRYRPARVDGRASGAWIVQPITFLPSRPATPDAQPASSRIAVWHVPVSPAPHLALAGPDHPSLR